MDPQTRKRVKVYELNQSSEWIDQGTGQCSFMTQEAGCFLVVRSEDTGDIILESKVLPGDVYQRQQDTLIVWTEPDGLDLALSFQEPAGCNDIWEQIQEVNPKMDDSEDVQLPKPEFANLKEIEGAISQLAMGSKERLVNALTDDKYYLKLLDLFEVCEDMEDADGLTSLFMIIKKILMLNEQAILEPLLKDDNILKVIGILEYNPEYGKRPEFREHIKQDAVFRQAVPLPDRDTERRVHHTFRVQYLKNNILPRSIDDNAFSALNLIVSHNLIIILSRLHADEIFLKDLFALLLRNDTAADKFRDAVEFIQELCAAAKGLQELKTSLYKALCKQGFLNILAPALSSPDLKTRLATAGVLSLVMEFDSSMLRTFILAEETRADDPDEDPTEARRPLLATIVRQFVDEPDLDVRTHLCEIIRSLLDGEAMDAANAGETQFISHVYERHMDTLMEPFNSFLTLDPHAPFNPDPDKASLYAYLCELLCMFVQHHTYHIKSYILRNNIISRTQALLRCKERYLVLAAIRFFRAVLRVKDDAYIGHVIQNKLFEPVCRVFEANKARNNLVNSALLDLFELVRHENMKKLISHIMDNYASSFEGVTYVETFRLLGTRNEQNKELHNGFPASAADRPLMWQAIKRRREERDLDEDEEAYFNDDDEDMSAAAGSESNENALGNGNGHGVAASHHLGPVPRKDSVEDLTFTPPARPAKLLSDDYDDNDDDANDDGVPKGPSPPPKRMKVDDD